MERSKVPKEAHCLNTNYAILNTCRIIECSLFFMEYIVNFNSLELSALASEFHKFYVWRVIFFQIDAIRQTTICARR